MKLIDTLKSWHILKKDYLAIVFFTAMACFYYDSILDNGPMNNHLWRQTDCLSLSHHYAQGAHFFEPEMHALLGDNFTTGLTAGEFPILYYIVGQIWKVFGESYFSYRLFYLLILFGGILSLYKSLRIVFSDFLFALITAALLFTAPVYVIYGISFLTDAPAFSFVLVGIYFLVKYKQKDSRWLFALSMFFFALGGLIKVSSLMAFFFLASIFLLETIFSIKSLRTKKLFEGHFFEWVGFGTVLAVIFSWYYYASVFNAIHGFKYTFNNIYPVWIMDGSDMGKLLNEISIFTGNVFFNLPMLLALLAVLIFNLFLWKKLPPFAYLANIILFVGSVIYFLLWAPLLGVHDYYYTALLILFISIIIPFMWFLKTSFPKFFHGYIFRAVYIGFFAYCFMYCLAVVKLKTVAQKGEFPIVGNDTFVGLMRWSNWEVEFKWMRFERMRPYMKEIGIHEDDKVISLPDKSFNVSLYLMGRHGWSDYLTYTETEEIDLLIEKGAKYLFISDPELLKEDFIQPFLHSKIGNFEGIEIYKL